MAAGDSLRGQNEDLAGSVPTNLEEVLVPLVTPQKAYVQR